MDFFDLLRNSAAESGDHRTSTNPLAAGSRRRRAFERLRRRGPAVLLPFMFAANGDPPPVDAALHATSADDNCLSLARGPAGSLGFGQSGGGDGHCMTTALPLMDQTKLSSGTLSSDLELSNPDFGQMTAQEVKVKFGLGRDLFAGLHATVDGSVGRVLGDIAPVLDQQLRANLSRPIDGHWETGLEARLASLGTIGLTDISQRTGSLFLRGHYNFFSSPGTSQGIELKLSADATDTSMQSNARHARADLRYEFRRDSSVLSLGLNATDSEPVNGPATPSLALDLRATRRF